MTVHLSREINKLKNQMLMLTTLVDESLTKAVKAVSEKDKALAREVIRGDEKIDIMEIDIEEECLKILALHQPVAIDLRYVIACLKMNNDLERIGDLAVNIAERAVSISKARDHRPVDFNMMAEKSLAMVKAVLEALIDLDKKKAQEVCAADDEVDDLNRQMHEELEKMMEKKSKRVQHAIDLMSVSRYLERIADYATNIAEDIIYMIDGKIVRHHIDEAGRTS